MVGHLLDALGGDRCEHGVAAGHQAFEEGEAPGGEDEDLRDRLGEVAIGHLGEADVAEVEVLTEVGEPVLVRDRGALRQGGHEGGIRGGGAGEEEAGLTEEVEGDVRERDVLFEVGGARAPFGDALGEDEGVVAEHEAVLGERARVDALGHGRVDAGQRVLEVGAEGPVGVVDEQAGVGVVVVVVVDGRPGFVMVDVDLRRIVRRRGLSRFARRGGVRVRHVILSPHMWGTSSGMS